MYDILHRIGIEAPRTRAYEAFASREGLSGWWTKNVAGDETVGGTLTFAFDGEGFSKMKVLELVPGELVRWECVDGAPEWRGTHISFELREDKGETVVLFSQRGWKQQVEFMHACSTKWAIFLVGAKALVETGHGTPYPDDPKISRWF